MRTRPLTEITVADLIRIKTAAAICLISGGSTERIVQVSRCDQEVESTKQLINPNWPPDLGECSQFLCYITTSRYPAIEQEKRGDIFRSNLRTWFSCFDGTQFPLSETDDSLIEEAFIFLGKLFRAVPEERHKKDLMNTYAEFLRLTALNIIQENRLNVYSLQSKRCSIIVCLLSIHEDDDSYSLTQLELDGCSYVIGLVEHFVDFFSTQNFTLEAYFLENTYFIMEALTRILENWLDNYRLIKDPSPSGSAAPASFETLMESVNEFSDRMMAASTKIFERHNLFTIPLWIIRTTLKDISAKIDAEASVGD